MALFRKLFYRKPPDGLLEICERVYVFDCCFTTDVWEEKDYKVYVGGIIGQLRDHYPDASILVFNFREGETQSQIANALSEYDMTIMDYPRHYEGCPLLSMEVIHHFLRSSESWLSLGLQNVLLVHCERGGWPVLAFMLAALLIYRKYYTGEHKTLDMIYKQAPRELLHLLSPLNPLPSQLRYLQYVSRRNVASEWPPLDRALKLDCVMIRMIPNFDGEGGCRPIFRIYGQNPFLVADRTPKVLFSTPKRSKTARHYRQAECELVKIDINCNIQGDVVLECISLYDDMKREEMMFRVMFNTAFIRSNILMLNRDEIDILWDAKDQFPKDFRAEVLFSEMDAAASIVPVDLSCFEEKEGLPVEAFAKVQEIFCSVDWLVPKADAALNVLQQITASNIVQDKFDTGFNQSMETSTFLHELTPEKSRDKQGLTAFENNTTTSSHLALEEQSVSSPRLPPNADGSERKAELESLESKSESIFPLTPPPPPPPARRSFTASDTESIAAAPPPPAVPLHNLSASEPTHPSLSELPDSYSHRSVQSMLVPPPAIETPSSGTINKNSLSNLPSTVAAFATAPSALPLPTLLSEDNPATVTRAPLPRPTPPPPPTLHPASGVGQFPSPPLRTPQPPPTPPLKDITAIRIGPSPAPPPPTTLPNPSTLHLKDNTAIRIRPPSPPPPPPPTPPPPPPPTLPLKNDTVARIGPPPTSLLRQNPAVSIGMSPPPPPPPKPPLKESSALRAGPPPPPPPPPLHYGQAAGTTISSSVPRPPPPPAPSTSSKNLDLKSQNSSRVPSAPPPPVPSGKGDLKVAAVPLQSLSTGSGGDSNLSGSSSPTPPIIPPSITKGRSPSRTMISRNHQTKKLKPLHWLKLTRAAQGSLWAEAQKSGEASKAPDIDISELESLFSAAVPNSDQGGLGVKSNSRASLGHKSEKVQLIEHRRAYNCEIMLSKVKMPLHELMGSVLALEESALDVDQVDNLIKFCPTNEEMELLKGYKGEKDKLGRCEQFFLELMQVPRTESKLRVFSFKIQFRSQVFDLGNNLNAVNSAAEQIKSSTKLKKVMQTILSLGNALNQGTARGSAIGFRLDSLLKLTETRARNNKITLMHYLCKVLADKLPELLDFSKDLASLERASKLQLKFLAEEMQAVTKGLEKVVQELSMSENDGPVSENFRKALKEFLSYAEGEVRSLASLYSGVGRNVDALILYFGEDPSRCPFEQVVSTLLNFVRMFNQAHEENCKQLEVERKKTEKETGSEKSKINASPKDSQHLINSPIKNVE